VSIALASPQVSQRSRCPGTALARPFRQYIAERTEIVDRGHVTPCWIWQQSVNHAGYGVGRRASDWVRIHRATYEEYVGPIPDGLQIDHLCRVRACCNPEHLETVTAQENARRKWSVYVSKAKPKPPKLPRELSAHCPHGHERTPENTRYRKNGWRECAVCRREFRNGRPR
jgi:hypothetical protein